MKQLVGAGSRTSIREFIAFIPAVRAILAVGVSLIIGIPNAQATTHIFRPLDAGEKGWDWGGQWDGGAPPNANTTDVIFMDAANTNGTKLHLVGLDRTVRSMTFSNTVASTSYIALNNGGGTARNLRLDTDAGSASITVQNGMAADITIGSGNGGAVGDVWLYDDLVIDHNGSGLFKITGNIANYAGGPVTITKTGSGEVRVTVNALTSPFYELMLSEGTYSFAGASSLRTNITMNGGTLRWVSQTVDLSSQLVFVNGKTATFDTYGNTVEFASTIGSGTTASLVKEGAGILYLNADNTSGYSGDTIVSNGTLRLKSTSLNSATTVRVASGAKLTINNGENVTVDALYLDGAPAAPGTYGSTSSSADNKNDTYFNAVNTGIMTVNNGPTTFLWDPGGVSTQSWGVASNWANLSVPTAARTDNDVVFMDTTLTNSARVYLGGANRKVRSMVFSNTVDSASYIECNNGSGTARELGFDTDAGSATLTVQAGAEANITIGKVVTAQEGSMKLYDDLVVEHNGTGLLKFNSNISGNVADLTITKTGSGELHIDRGVGSNPYKVLVSEGILRFKSDLTLANDIIMNGGTLRWGSVGDDISDHLVLSNGVAATFDAYGYDVTFVTAIGNSTTASLVKEGAGTLTLADANTFTGDTVVSNGTLALSSSTTLDSGTTVRIASGAKMLINGGVNQAVAALYFGATKQSYGTWGSTASSAAHKDDTRFDAAGTGILTVPSPSNGSIFSFE